MQRGVSVAGVGVRMTGMVVVVSMMVFLPMIRIIAVGTLRHGPILRAQGAPAQPSDWLIRQFDTAFAGMD